MKWNKRQSAHACRFNSEESHQKLHCLTYVWLHNSTNLEGQIMVLMYAVEVRLLWTAEWADQYVDVHEAIAIVRHSDLIPLPAILTTKINLVHI